MPEETTVLRKRMVVCTAFGRYINGDDEGEMTPDRLKAIALRFATYPRQVPVYARGDHEFDADARIPDGWVESLEFTTNHPSGGALIAETKLHGDGAILVGKDLIRGASIGTVQGKNPDGSPQGEVLQHLLLSNAGFDKSLNIAAASLGGEAVCSVFTTLGDSDMEPNEKKVEEMSEHEKDEVIKDLRAQVAGLTAKLEDMEKDKTPAEMAATEKLLRDRTEEVASLKAAKSNLENDVRRLQEQVKHPELVSQLKQQERTILAQKVRRLVAKGVSEGKFTAAHVGEPEDGWDNNSDEVVLAWFKSSMFNDSVDRLEFALSSFEKKKFNQTYDSGRPRDGAETVLSDQDRAYLRKRGMNPEVVQAGMKALNLEDYKAQLKEQGIK